MQKLENWFFSLATIYISKSKCIYENLAFEEWLFRNHNLEQNGDAILIWSNKPAIVIGRYQNPFVETNLKYCETNKIKIARRFSGGGAVYHDLGNLNVSILTTQKRHNRQRNLISIANYLNFHYLNKLNIIPNKKDDLIFSDTGCKISGTAAKISNNRSCHHFTILVNISLETLNAALNSNLKEKIFTNATKSQKANSVGFINQRIPQIKISDVKNIIIEVFQKQYKNTNFVIWTPQFNYLNENLNLKLEKNNIILEFINYYNLLKSKEWIFNRTPKFEFKFIDFGKENSIIVDKGVVKESIHPIFSVENSFYQTLKTSKFY